MAQQCNQSALRTADSSLHSRTAAAAAVLVILLSACSGGGGGGDPDEPTAPAALGNCAPGLPPLLLEGGVEVSQRQTYELLPFDVAAGVTRIEFIYEWQDRSTPPPSMGTVIDLGLWDQNGPRAAAGFRGWSGSRLAKQHVNPAQPPAFVAVDTAARGYYPGEIVAGTWNIELGYGWVSDSGADWRVTVTCLDAPVGPVPPVDPVDPTHVANSAEGWYHADFHMHGYHSAAAGPGADEFVAQARAANLDVLPVTEYVTGRHWAELGAMQRANTDLLVWPGREIITYLGHANSHGETPGVLEYRHGFEDITLAAIQRDVVAAGALFQINHPTTFPPPTESQCRGCSFELRDDIDWSQVQLLEVVTSPVLATASDLPNSPPFPGQIENPFLQPALDLWDELLLEGHFITAVSGSDSKGHGAPGDINDPEFRRRGYGSTSTAIFSASLSRADLTAALLAGRAYIRVRGVADSPELAMMVTGPGAQSGSFGDTILLQPTEQATLSITVTNGDGQTLRLLQNGTQMVEVVVSGSPFTHDQVVTRSPQEGPLGTYWRVETRDADSRTTIGNPVFLAAP